MTALVRIIFRPPHFQEPRGWQKFVTGERQAIELDLVHETWNIASRNKFPDDLALSGPPPLNKPKDIADLLFSKLIHFGDDFGDISDFSAAVTHALDLNDEMNCRTNLPANSGNWNLSIPHHRESLQTH